MCRIPSGSLREVFDFGNELATMRRNRDLFIVVIWSEDTLKLLYMYYRNEQMNVVGSQGFSLEEGI